MPFEDGRKTVTRYGYDGAGNVLSQRITSLPETTFARETRYLYDGRNRVLDTIQTNNGIEYRTRNKYDAAGNKEEVYTGMLGDSLNGAQKTTYTYNWQNKVETMKDPQGYTESYLYDVLGRLKLKTDRNGSRTGYTYDGLDRLLSEKVTATNAHGDTTSTRTFTYDSLGQKVKEIATEQTPEGTTTLSSSYIYDNRGLLAEQTDQSESDTIVKRYGYDDNGNRNSFTLHRNNGQELNMAYDYDSLNRLKWVRRDGGEIAHYDYDQNGNRLRMTYPGGIATTYGYNDANLVKVLENKRNGAPVSRYEYTYDPDGNQRTKKETVGSKVKTVTYDYDDLGRLETETDPDWNTITYEYDRFGNRGKMTVTGGEFYTTTYAYGPSNWLMTETKKETKTNATEIFRYQYDRNGNQSYREWERMEAVGGDGPGRVGFAAGEKMRTREKILELRSYNGLNQLVWLYRDGDVTTYRYRPDGMRHSKTTGAGATTHFWDGQNIVLEVTANGNRKSRFYRGINLISQGIGGDEFHYLFNAHGDVVQRLQPDGQVARSYHYNAFGLEKEELETDPNPFRYCGEYYDRESEEYYLRARYYSPRLGRFGAEDVAKDGLNWYTYCGNNPVSFMDPSGMSWIDDMEEYWNEFGNDASEWWKNFTAGNNQRLNALRNDPSFYNFVNFFKHGYLDMNNIRFNEAEDMGDYANWLFSGIPEMMYDATHPDEPLSFEHWMNSIGTGVVVYVGYRGIQNVAANTNATNPFTKNQIPVDKTYYNPKDDAITLKEFHPEAIARHTKYLSTHGKIQTGGANPYVVYDLTICRKKIWCQYNSCRSGD